MIHCSLWDRYPSLGTIITSDKRGALAVKSHHSPWQLLLTSWSANVKHKYKKSGEKDDGNSSARFDDDEA